VEKIPVMSRAAQFINEVIRVSEGSLRGTCVSFGNPHCVLLVEDIASAPVKKLGAELEKHEIFPERTNVEFVQVISESELNVRVWERGAGETLACGTGACAATVVSAKLGLAGRKVRVNLPGGSLVVDWQSNDLVILEGPAREVFTGKIEWPE
jgi:diaminopimelate epimerase